MLIKTLLWSTRALAEYEGLLDYLLDEWNEEIAIRVTRELEETIQRIQDAPEQFPVLLKRKKVRRAVMSPQTSIFFKVSKTEVEIISLFDNRQNPRKRKL